MKQQGFTLIEITMTVAIIGVLGAVAVRAYEQAATRASFAQQLVDIDHIRKVVAIESRDGQRDLLAGAQPGRAPAALSGQLPDSQFHDGKGLRLQLVRVPAGTFASHAARGSFGLVAQTTGSRDRFWLFQREVERAGFETAWLSEASFVFPITAFAGDAAAATAPQASAPPPIAAVEPPPVVPAPPVQQQQQQPPPAAEPARPSGAAPFAGAPSACPPGEEARGQGGKCRPVADGGSCPAGWSAAGQGGTCRPDRKPGDGP